MLCYVCVEALAYCAEAEKRWKNGIIKEEHIFNICILDFNDEHAVDRETCCSIEAKIVLMGIKRSRPNARETYCFIGLHVVNA